MNVPQDHILVLNAGSSSLKFAVFSRDALPRRLVSGAIDRIGSSSSTFQLRSMDGQRVERTAIFAPTHASCLPYVLERVTESTGSDKFAGVGHRVVHGGPKYFQSQPVTHGMLEDLRLLSPFAPEHLPAEIDLIAALTDRFPDLFQVACFDTGFHRELPRVAALLPIPRRYQALGVRRYGFHGLSFEFLMEELAREAGTAAANGRVILAHLGNGASLAAVRGGRCVDTSMGFTPAAGLVMGRRSGDMDPGLVAFLARSEGMTAEQFDKLVNQQCGMLGISEISSDMRELLRVADQDVRAAEAVELFCYQAKKWIGSFSAALGGLDTLVFAGGIGENGDAVRARICDGLGFLGIELSESRNAAQAGVISTDNSRVQVRVIRTDEELLIARSVARLLTMSRNDR